jgi:hypothetical protein
MIYAIPIIALLVFAYHLPTGIPAHKKRIKYRRGIKYQLIETYAATIDIRPDSDIQTQWLSLTKGGVITIASGYCWDGPSGPTWDSRNFMRAALVHDAIYQLIRMEKLGKNDIERSSFRNAGDIEMGIIQKEDRMNPARRFVTHFGVSKFASYAADPKHRRKVFTAPTEEPDE